MGRQTKPHTLFLFDEPTIGLHFADVETLLAALQSLVDQGHSVVVIEHNMEIAKSADWIVDLGPEGGDGGGTVVAAGTPEEIAACDASHTGRYLREALAGPARDRAGRGAAAGRRALRQRRRRRHAHRRRQGAQPARRRHRPAARPVHRRHRAERLRQVDARLRHRLRRGAAPLPRQPVDLRAPVREGAAAPQRRPAGRRPGDSRHRAAPEPRQQEVDGGHGHRDLPLPAPALRQDRRAALHRLRPRAELAHPRADRRPPAPRAQGPERDAAEPRRARAQGHLPRALPDGAQARLPPGADRRQDRRALPAAAAGALPGARHRYRRSATSS